MKALLEKRAKLAQDIRSLADLANDEKHAWSGEDEARWTAVNADFDKLTQQIERAERAQKVEKLLDAPPEENPQIGILRDKSYREEARAEARGEDSRDDRGPPTEQDRALALQGWMRRQCGQALTREQLQACRRTRQNPSRRDFVVELRRDPRAALRELRAIERRDNEPMSTSAGTGGDFIPTGFVPRLEVAMKLWSAVEQVAEIVRTNSGSALPWPTVNDTAVEGELLAESTAAANEEVATGVMTLNAFKFSSKLIWVPVELLEDSAFNLANILADLMGERLGRIKNGYFTTGTGSSQPNGIVTAATAGVTTAGATAITADELKDMVHSIDPAYRQAPGAGWMMHDAVLLYVRKLKSAVDGHYIWDDRSLQPGQPQRLLGYPITINPKMASTIAATNITALFGDLAKYKVREVRRIRIRRLVERYAEKDQEAFIAFVRSDGDLLDAGANPVKKLTQHA